MYSKLIPPENSINFNLYTPCHHGGPCIQLLQLTYNVSSCFFIDIPDVWVWVIRLFVMPVLLPPTGHLTDYEASAEYKHWTHQWERTKKQEGIFGLSQNNMRLAQFRLFKCFLRSSIWGATEFEGTRVKIHCNKKIFGFECLSVVGIKLAGFAFTL